MKRLFRVQAVQMGPWELRAHGRVASCCVLWPGWGGSGSASRGTGTLQFQLRSNRSLAVGTYLQRCRTWLRAAWWAVVSKGKAGEAGRACVRPFDAQTAWPLLSHCVAWEDFHPVCLWRLWSQEQPRADTSAGHGPRRICQTEAPCRNASPLTSGHWPRLLQPCLLWLLPVSQRASDTGGRLSFWLTWDRAVAVWFWPAAYHFITAPCFVLHGFQTNLQDLLQGAWVLLQRQRGAWLSSQREGGVVP